MKKSILSAVMAGTILLSGPAMSSPVEKYSTNAPIATDVQKRLFSKIFDVELWSQSYPENYEQDITIRVILAINAKKSQIIDFMADEAQDIHGFSRRQFKELSTVVDNAFDCTPSADSIIDFNFIPGTGVEITCDGVRGENPIADGVFSHYLLDIFLHEKSEFTNLANPG